MRLTRLFGLMMCVVLFTGCTVVTQEQKDWVTLKAERSALITAMIESGAATDAQKDAWITENDESWQLWREKMDMGLAAPSWAVKADVPEEPDDGNN